MSRNNPLTMIFKAALAVCVFIAVNIWAFIESVLFVGGLIGCIMLPVQWPMKFVYAALWLVVFYAITRLFGMLENYLGKNKKRN
jgi:energy-coupling factor transporter transmembrane protein EcfT